MECIKFFFIHDLILFKWQGYAQAWVLVLKSLALHKKPKYRLIFKKVKWVIHSVITVFSWNRMGAGVVLIWGACGSV
jgi:hypothetical protein